MCEAGFGTGGRGSAGLGRRFDASFLWWIPPLFVSSAVMSGCPDEEEAGGGVKAVPARLLERKEQLCPGAGGSGCVDSGPCSLSAAQAQPSGPEP